MEKRDIQNMDDIHLLVDTFYGRIREDDLLADVFNERIQDRWPQHIAKMYTFWQTMLLREHTYFSSPFPPHATLPVQAEHFERWLHLWRTTLDEFWAGEIVEEAVWRAEKMAEMFQYKIGVINERNRYHAIRKNS